MALSDPSPLRVLLVITRGERGGAQVHVRDLVLALRDRVHFDVVIGEGGFLPDSLREGGINVVILPSMGRAVSPRDDARSLRELRLLIARHGPHLVHTHSSKAGILGRLAAWSAGVPSVHTAHAWSFSDGQPSARVVLSVPPEWLVGRVTSRFIAVSHADAEVGTRYRVARPSQVTVIHNGVADVDERGDPGASGPCRFLMVARFLAPKDHALLLDAFARVPGPAELWLVGDGPLLAAAEARASRPDLLGRVRFLGNRGDVAGLYAQVQVGVLVSLQEGFPLVVLEAMRAGLPVVASDVGGTREAVEDGATGRLVPRGDGEALVGALSSLAGDPAARARMGAAGRRAYEDRFSVRPMAAATLRVYAEIASTSAPGPVSRPELGRAALVP